MLIGVFYSLKTNILLFVYQLKCRQESLFLLLEKNISSKKMTNGHSNDCLVTFGNLDTLLHNS